MKRREETGIETGERRRTRRSAARGRVKLSVQTTEIEGLADNISQTGILFFSEGDFRVVLEIEEDGVVRKVGGRLVRAQRMRADDIGWAIEIDPA